MTRSMNDAMRHAGIDPRYVEFDIAIAKLLNSGGTIEGALERLRVAAERMSGRRQDEGAALGHTHIAPPRQPLEGGEATPDLPRGLNCNASPPSSNRGGEGHTKDAQSHRTLAPPVREPVQQKPATTTRGLAAIVSAQSAVKEGYLIIQKTSDGKPWGRVGWHELDGMVRDGVMSRMIKARANPPKNRFAVLDDVLTDSQFREIYEDAQKQITAV